MITILSFLAVLTVLVLVHELGHFTAAKKLGVRVETFAIGFGPRLFKIRRGETDYVLRLIPLGGYVQLGEAGTSKVFRPGSPNYGERPPLDKMIVSAAGPAANLILAVIVLSIISLVGITSPKYMSGPASIGWVAPGSPSDKAGLKAGDAIVAVDGEPVSTWQDLSGLLPLYKKDIRMVVTRAGKTKTDTVAFSGVSRLTIGFSPAERITVASVLGSSPAQRAGLQPGDIVLTAAGYPVASWAAFQHALSSVNGPMPITVERLGKSLTLQVVPSIDPKTGKTLVGISYSPETVTKKLTFPEALRNGFVTTGTIVSDAVGTFRGLLTGSLSLKMLGGPVAIAQASGNTAKNGLIPLLSFLAFLSVQLGIFNLLPFFPIVDGGQITIFLFEAVRRRPMGTVSLEWILKAGWAAMGVLILFVTYNDVMRLF